METWTTILVALIVALSTLGATFIQSWHSNKRFKIELGRAIDVEAKKTRWEVRSEPLLKLRTELARMATKQDKLVAVVYIQYSKRFDFSPKELQETINDSNNYLAKGDFLNALLTLDDTEIMNKARETLWNYQESLVDAMRFNKLKKEERTKALESIETNRNKVIEVQKLINKRLEEL